MPEERNEWQGIAALLSLLFLAIGNAFNSIWSDLSAGTALWSLCNVISACTQWAMPAMVMLIGSIFLSTPRRMKTKLLWKRYIPLAAISCVVWWLLAAVVWIQSNHIQDLDWITFRECMAEVLEPPANIGFCQMVFSFFLLYPFLYTIAENEKVLRYGIVLIFIMGLLETVFRYIPYFSVVGMFADQLNWGYYRAWAFYLLCGIWITKHTLSWKTSLLIYCLGILSTGSMIALTNTFTTFEPGYANEFIGYSSPFTGIQTLAVLLFAKRMFAFVHAPRLTRTTKDLWYGVSVLFVVSLFTERLTELFLPSTAGGILSGAVINTISTFLIILALGSLPGFRTLVGDYSHEGA